MAKINFTFGRGFGALLVEIAREKIYTQFDPEAGLDVIRGSLAGEISDDLIYKLLRGDIILDCEDGHTLEAKDYNEKTDVSFYRVNIGSWLRILGDAFYHANKKDMIAKISYTFHWVLNHLYVCEEDLAGYKNISRYSEVNFNLNPDCFCEILQKIDEYGAEVTIKYLETLSLFDHPTITDSIKDSGSYDEIFYSGNRILMLNKTTRNMKLYKILTLGYIPIR